MAVPFDRTRDDLEHQQVAWLSTLRDDGSRI